MEEKDITRLLEQGCPFARETRMRMREAEEDGGRITIILEDNPANLNAFGLVHAGAICGLAETAGGMAIMRHLDPREVLILNTVFNIRYVHPPRGELRCTALVLEEEVKALLDEFQREGKADKAVDLKVFDASGTLVAQAQATYRLMKTPEEYKGYFAQ